jgi:queuine tRNA-ribosyltransferase
MKFKLLKQLNNGVRIGEVETVHGKISTPFFMPVGTKGSVKGISPDELKNLGAQIVLSNTYHLYLRPGEKLIKKLGGLHKFMGWNGPILTDSGGYQVFSLGERGEGRESLVKVADNGAEFKSFLDGSMHLFTPEKVIQIQLDLGVDILMPLDVCPSGKSNAKEIEKASLLSIEWAKRAKIYFDKKVKNIPENKRPALFGIVQGGLDLKLRERCATELIELDFDGYSVGGLAVDHETRDMWATVDLMGKLLPEDKPRYLMGVGTPDDIIKATALGMDMFDCVLPTRLARHGVVFVRESKKAANMHYRQINLMNSKFRTDPSPIDKACGCPACKGGFSRAYISHLLRENEMFGLRLATLHNLHAYLDLMRSIG